MGKWIKKMGKSLRIFVVIMMILMGLTYSVSVIAVPMDSQINEQKSVRREKARYYFLQGSLEASLQNMGQAYEYFKKAYEIDPEFSEAGFNYGSQRIFMRVDTLQSDKELKRSMKMMQDYVDENPQDLYSAQVYGYVTTALDTVEEAIRVYETAYELMPRETQILPVLADAYMRRFKTKEAIGSLNKYESIEGKSQDLSLKKITILMATQDTVGAIEEANRLVAHNPRDPYSHILKGNLYDVVGNLDSVYASYKEAERLAPASGPVKMSLAQYYREMGDSVMLDNMMYGALLSEDLELEDKLGILGDYLQKLLDEEGDRGRGDHLFSVLQSQYPHEPDVLEMAARYSGAKGDYKGAAEAIGYAINMDSSNEQYWLMLLSYELTDNDYEAVVRDYKRSQEYLNPSIKLKKLYAAAASMLKDSKESEKIITGLLEETDSRLLDENSRLDVRRGVDYETLTFISSLYCMLGDLHYKNGEPAKGFEDYEVSLNFLPDNALTLNNYAYFLSEEGMELEKAKKMSRRTLDLVENNPTYLDTYAWILYKLGEYHEAMEYMKLALEIAEQQGDENEEYKIHYDAIEKALQEERERAVSSE